MASSALPKTNGVVKPNGVAQSNGRSVEHPTPLENLIVVSVVVLRQAVDFLNENITSDEQLSYRSKYIPGSTIGKHLRHARDHFMLLLHSVAPGSSASPAAPADAITVSNGDAELPALCYDTRTRNTPMETSRAAAVEAFEGCIAQLQEVAPRVPLERALSLSAVTPHLQVFGTTFGRELWFAALHAVHHWSMVRVVAGELNIKLEDTFGVAPSTLIYHGTEGALGKSKI